MALVAAYLVIALGLGVDSVCFPILLLNLGKFL